MSEVVEVTNNGTANEASGPTAPLGLLISQEVDETPFISIVLEDSETGTTLADVFIDDESEADRFLATVQQAVTSLKKANQEEAAKA